MKSRSDQEPERLVKGKDKAQYNYNIEQITVTDVDGTTRRAYQCDYVEIEGKITKAKIVKALENTKLDLEEDFNPEEIETTYKETKEALKLSVIANLSYEQLDTYIDTNVKNLAMAKEYLKKLSKVVLALLKYSDIK